MSVLAGLIIAVTVVWAQNNPPARRSTQSSRPPGAPLTFEQVMKLVRLPERQALGLLTERGLGFDPSQEQVEQLRSVRASQRVLDFIQSKIKVEIAQPPPPPPPKPGTLTVNCVPVDCDVTAGGENRGSTTSGVLSGLSFPQGSVHVTVARADYDVDPPQSTVSILPEKTTEVTFRLKPNPTALSNVAAKEFAAAVAALGGQAALGETAFARWTGMVTVYGKDNAPIAWDVVAVTKPPGRAKFTVSRAGARYEAVRTDAGFEWNKKVSGGEITELEDAFRRILEFQLPSVLARIANAKPAFTTDQLELPAGMKRRVRAAGNPDIWVLELTAEKHPQEIRIESAGLSAGTRLLYADYTAAGKARVPLRMQVVVPDSPRQGVDVRWQKVELAPAVRDQDFVLKKGWKLAR